MSRDTTYNELAQTDAAGEVAEFVMDEESFRGFYSRNARGVWAYLARLTGDRQLADDLLQETFYRFLRAGGPFENENHRRNYLYRIAANVVRDTRRRNLVRMPFTATHPDLGNVSGPDHAAASERAADLTRALATLKPRERTILWLAYAEGASHHEIAGMVGVSAASLKAMLFRARRKLAEFLNPRREGGAR